MTGGRKQDTRRTKRLWSFVLELWDVACGDEVCGRAVQQQVDTPPPAANPVDGDEEGTDTILLKVRAQAPPSYVYYKRERDFERDVFFYCE